MLTFADAEKLMARSRSGRPRIQSRNTWLESRGPDAFAVRQHHTDVVTIHRDGSYTLTTGGWNTVTTKDRLNNWSPARIYSERGTWCVWHKSDPKTPPKMARCRSCRGYGRVHQPAAWRYITWDDRGRYKQIYPRELIMPAYWAKCWHCGGTGQRDYGSKAMPVIFYDGIRVDATGKVIRTKGQERLHDPRVIERRKKAEARARREAVAYERRVAREHKRALLPARVTEFIAEHQLAADKAAITAFKAVGEDLRSRHGMAYIPGATVTAPDYARTLDCGAGLHFSPTPAMARSYDRTATRFLACAVDRATAVVLNDKIKAASCVVLHEVDSNGQRLPDRTGYDPHDPGSNYADPIVFGS